MAASVTPNAAASASSPREWPRTCGRQAATSNTAASETRSMTVPAGPMLSKSVLAIAEPNWTEPIPHRTSATGGTPAGLAPRLVLVLERGGLQRVHRAQGPAAPVERGAGLGLRQPPAAPPAALLGYRG